VQSRQSRNLASIDTTAPSIACAHQVEHCAIRVTMEFANVEFSFKDTGMVCAGASSDGPVKQSVWTVRKINWFRKVHSVAAPLPLIHQLSNTECDAALSTLLQCMP